MTPLELFEKLKSNPHNPRTIKDKKFKLLVEKIKAFPQMLAKRPMVYDSSQDYLMLGGNRRRDAVEMLLKLGEIVLEDNYFADASDWTPEQKRQFIVIDNISDGDWNWDLLGNQYEAPELKEWGLDLPAYFDEDKNKEDEPPAVEEIAKSEYGKVYQLGSHRIICGDATKHEDIDMLMKGKKANMIFTDPPYNVDYASKNVFLNRADKGNRVQTPIKNDKKGNDDFYAFLLTSMQNLHENIVVGGAIYVAYADVETLNFLKAYTEAGFLFKQGLVWNKNNMVLGMKDYHFKHEMMLYGWKEGGPHKWYGSRSETTVWDIDKPTRSSEHPTMKPIALIAKALYNSSDKGDIVLDIFLGSGSTLIACEQAGRICYGMELDPKYVDVIRKRYWMQLHDGKDEGWEAGTPPLV